MKKKPSSGLFTPENFQLYIPGNRARGNDMDCAAPDPAGELSSSLERDFEQICRKDPEHMRGLLHHFSLPVGYKDVDPEAGGIADEDIDIHEPAKKPAEPAGKSYPTS